MLRKALQDDFDFIFNLYMHPQVNPWLLYEPMDEKEFQHVFESLQKSGLLYVFEKNKVSIGMCKLVPQTYRNAHIVYLGGLAIDPEQAGRKYGIQLMEAIKLFVKEQGFLRIELSVAVMNEKAIRLYEQAGFEKEGVLRKYTKLSTENKFIDEALMSYLF
jgi:RimJ/RimL family protein N-acetyltransferase